MSHHHCLRSFFVECFSSAAGTAILSKHKPLSVDKTLPGHPDPGSVKGRIVTLEFEDYYVIGTYVVNAGQNLKVCLHEASILLNSCFSTDPRCEKTVEPAF